MAEFHCFNLKAFIYNFKRAYNSKVTDKELFEDLFFVAGVNYNVNASTISKLLNDNSKIPKKVMSAFFEKNEDKLVEEFTESFEFKLDPTKLALATSEIIGILKADSTVSANIKSSLLEKAEKHSNIIFLGYVFLYLIKSKDITAKQNISGDLKSLNDHGIIGAYHNVALIPYTQLIKNAVSNIDIVHIHGDSWIKTSDRESQFREKMKNSNITIRLFLLSPKSPFFKACEEFIPSYEEGEMLFKLKSALKSWERIYSEATENRTKKGAKLYIYLTNQYPSKDISRFDNIMLVSSKYMGQGRSPYLPKLCCESRKNEESFFKNFMNELEEVAKESDICFDATVEPLTKLIDKIQNNEI